MDQVLKEGENEDEDTLNISPEVSTTKNHRRKAAGLANIGNQLFISGLVKDEDLEIDEDERVVELCNSLEIAQMSIRTVEKQLSSRVVPADGKEGQPSRVVFNLPCGQNKEIGNFLNLGDWLDAQV
jgi:hypothetical protein